MLFIIDPHSGVPAYRQLLEQVKFQIASGLLKPGDELPSTRALSAELRLNPMTISKAYQLLEHEGVLERRRGQTLMVAMLPEKAQQTHKLDQLRQLLVPVATAARQMGLPPQQATAMLRDLMQKNPPA
jgi:GntR family transcriptional regulator